MTKLLDLFLKNRCHAFILIVLGLFHLLFFLTGCSLFKSQPVVQMPPVKRTGDPIQDIRTRADRIRSIEIRGRLSIRTRIRKYRSFSVAIWFYSHSGRLNLRIRGSGPLGVSVFDLLADRQEAWIYVPREGKILKGNTFFTSHGSIGVDAAIQLMEICLNPWSPVRNCSSTKKEYKAERKDGRMVARIKCRFLGHDLALSYDLSSLEPLTFDSSLATISFRAGDSDQATFYPREISFNLKKDGICGTLKVQQVKVNTISPDSPIFERSIFSPLKTM